MFVIDTASAAGAALGQTHPGLGKSASQFRSQFVRLPGNLSAGVSLQTDSGERNVNSMKIFILGCSAQTPPTIKRGRGVIHAFMSLNNSFTKSAGQGFCLFVSVQARKEKSVREKKCFFFHEH